MEEESFGAYLRALRENADLSLRAVEDRCQVSNGYLSLLEQGKVKEPSPRILWQLAQCYSADYLDLMRRVGYPVPGGMPPANSGRPSIVFRGAERLTEGERREVQEFIKMKLRLRPRESSK